MFFPHGFIDTVNRNKIQKRLGSLAPTEPVLGTTKHGGSSSDYLAIRCLGFQVKSITTRFFGSVYFIELAIEPSCFERKLAHDFLNKVRPVPIEYRKLARLESIVP